MSRITVSAGRRYREVTLHAADTRAAARHISAERPVSYATQVTTRSEFPESRARAAGKVGLSVSQVRGEAA